MAALRPDALRGRLENFHQLGADMTAFLLNYAHAHRLSGQAKGDKYRAAVRLSLRVDYSAQGVPAVSEFFEFDGEQARSHGRIEGVASTC
jgi:hypothetical protein